MDHPLLNGRNPSASRARRALRDAAFAAVPPMMLFLVSGMFGACSFDDPVLEIDPALVHDSSFTYLAPTESRSVTRRHILESFGAYGCASCPDAESRLAPYFDSASTSYRPDLIVANYHVAFPSSITDPWITTGTQARQDGFGFTSLPQVKLNGSNAPYGIREKDVRFSQGEYDSLIARLRRIDSQTTLDFSLDTTVSGYDSAARRLTVRFTVYNRATAARGPLSFRVLAVKNKSVTIPTLPNHPWEVIVTETTEQDTSGAVMTLAGMPALTAKTWTAQMQIPLETERSPVPSVSENPANYAIVLFAKDASGIVQNAFAWHFTPK